MSAGREVAVIDVPAAAPDGEPPVPPADSEEAIDLDEWAGEDDLTTRLTKLAMQMQNDALALPVGHASRGPLLKDAAAILGRLLDKREPNAKPEAGGGMAASPGRSGGVAVAQVSRDDAAASYLRLIEGTDEGVA